MSRRERKSSTTNESQVETPNTEETAVTETAATENPAPEAPAEAPAEADAKATKPEADLSAFHAAVAAAVAESDTDTGTVPEASIAKVTEEYRKLDGIKAKNEAKKYVNEQMKDAMNSGNLAGARANLQISDEALVAAAAAGHRAERVPADPTEAFVQRVATLNLAQTLVSPPEGVAEDWDTKVTEMVESSEESAREYLAWLEADSESRGNEPEVTSVVRNAAKLAVGKTAKAGTVRTGGSFSGERRDIGAHILNAFEGKELGTFLSIAEIRNAKSPEYGDQLPSAGAISARLFPKDKEGHPTESSMLKLGIEPTTRDGKKGAVKGEVPEAEDEATE
jgi:hypothetical protein